MIERIEIVPGALSVRADVWILRRDVLEPTADGVDQQPADTALAATRADGRPFIDLTESNPTRAGFDYPADLLAPLADARGLALRAVSRSAPIERAGRSPPTTRGRGSTSPAERIVLTASTSEAYSLLFKLLADAGDEVLVPRPSYPLFDHLDAARSGRRAPLRSRHHGGVVDRLRERRTRADAADARRPDRQPEQPDRIVRQRATSSIGSRRSVRARGIAIIADEVFADYELDAGRGVGRRPRARRGSDVLSFSLGGLSKSVGSAAGQAWVDGGRRSRPHSSAAALERLELICDTYLSVSTPVQLAAAELLERGAAVRAQIRRARRGELPVRCRRRPRAAPACRVLDAATAAGTRCCRCRRSSRKRISCCGC